MPVRHPGQLPAAHTERVTGWGSRILFKAMKTATVTPLAVLQPASDSVKVPVCALSYSILAMTLRGWWWSWGLDGPIFLMRKLRPRGGKRLVQGDRGQKRHD